MIIGRRFIPLYHDGITETALTPNEALVAAAVFVLVIAAVAVTVYLIESRR